MASKNCFSRLLVGCTVVLVLSACGGGGGDGVTEPPTITKEATLTIGQEIPAVPPANVPAPADEIKGTMTVTLTTATNAISGALTLSTGTSRVTAAHIHDGDIGAAGAPVITLTANGNVFSIPAGTVLTAAEAARFKAGGYYVNVHTLLNEAGEVRGQLLGFTDNIQPIFTANCAVSTCHVPGGSSGAPMSLAAGASYGNLVNQPASVGTRVIPDNSADSVLFKRITGTTAGPRMPPSPAPLLPATTQNLIKVWIDMGAKNN